MKKEKQIKAYTRRTKSGKMVTVKAHTAKYDAADMAKEALKKKGAGDEFEQRYRSQFEKKPAGAGSTGRIKKETDQDKAAKLKEVVAKLKKAKASDTPKTKPASKTDSTAKKQPVGGGSTGRVKKDATTKKTVPTKSADSTSVSSADFKTWYHDPHSAAGKKVATQLRKQLGISQYNRLNKQADESYSTRGHLTMYKALSGTPAKTPAGSGSTGRTKKTSGDSEKLTKFKEVVSKLKKAKEADMTKKQPVSGGATGRMKKNTVATKSPSVKDTFGVSDSDLKTWWYHPYSKRGLEINKQIKKKIGSRALTNLVVFSMDSASKGQKADSAAFKYVKGLTKFTRKNLKVDTMK